MSNIYHLPLGNYMFIGLQPTQAGLEHNFYRNKVISLVSESEGEVVGVGCGWMFLGVC